VTRGARKKTKEQPERRCIATGLCRPTSELIRFVVGPDATITPDISGKLPGRGIWVSASRESLNKAVAKKLFGRAAKTNVVVSDDLVIATERLLSQHVISLISLARKSGLAIAGFEKVKAAVVSGKARYLVQASDGSIDQRAKIRAPNGEKSLISCLTARELGLAFGRENVIHAALGAGGLGRRAVEQASKLSCIRLDDAQLRAKTTGPGPETESVDDE